MAEKLPKKIKTSIQIEERTLKRAKQIAKAERRTVSSVVEVLVEERYAKEAVK